MGGGGGGGTVRQAGYQLPPCCRALKTGQAYSHTASPCASGQVLRVLLLVGGCHTHYACMMLPQPSPKPNGSDGWQPQTRASHRPTWGENELLGREEATGYLPPNADKQGQPVTEQKGGSHRQKENNKKAHLNHSSESQPRQSTGKHTGSGEKGTCFSGRGFPGSVDTNSVAPWDGLCSDGCKHDPLWKATAQGQSHQCWGVWLPRVGSG